MFADCANEKSWVKVGGISIVLPSCQSDSAACGVRHSPRVGLGVVAVGDLPLGQGATKKLVS